MHWGKDYWKNYMERWFGKELIGKWEKYVIVEEIQSNDKKINIEIYDTGNKEATTIIFAHGIAGYARVLLPFTMPLFEKGYNLVIPDMQGYGYNNGLKGDFEWNAHKQNIKDTIQYTRTRFGGKVILGGASMGGPLAYAAACESEEIDALVCWCLWDFSDREFMLNETNTKKLTYLLIPVFKFISKFMGKVRIKTYRLVSYDTLTDSHEFNEIIKDDPQAGTHITLKGAVSLIIQSKPYKSHDDYIKPILVLQPEKDKMTPRHYTEKVFKKLGAANKKYVEIKDAPHFPTEKKYYKQWAEEVDAFIKSI
jgi:alpha-beta hydrolase superfamily lysophospholipase